jgi:hypothetical protein
MLIKQFVSHHHEDSTFNFPDGAPAYIYEELVWVRFHQRPVLHIRISFNYHRSNIFLALTALLNQELSLSLCSGAQDD